MSVEEVLVRLVNDLGAFALIALGYRAVFKHFAAAWARSVVLGIMFGMGALWAILNSAEVRPGVFVDARCVMIALAGPFGGPVSTVLAAALASLYRLWLGGAGAYTGTANIIVTAIIGIVSAHALGIERNVLSRRHLAWLGLASSAGFLTIFALPSEIAWPIFKATFIPVLIANALGVLLLGQFLGRERRSLDRQHELEVEAFVDPLTKLPNRRMLERVVAPMIQRTQDGHGALSVLVIDIDHFKQVNDRYGHDAGDVVLQQVAQIVRRNIRSQDAVARFGGEELIVAMPSTEAAAASAMADRIREIIARETGRNLGVTVSIGVAADRGKQATFKRLFKAADEALYFAKQNGRNQIALAAG
ncbi:GGDEF domain-containing protein [Antarcticirhabdus aurantiaca]|uniref:Diguanylate cyclase n=1 Tax=Antarcticirhabdus aurantiaca TaxID=2606717 RepID=A0ACD4NQ98_9HYPH|nr:diguanylate cyclase [Antarcticirhabdus aurantiaca]WAJ28908.1 diguanylate cyclase [Jeongeuplla avenae]